MTLELRHMSDKEFKMTDDSIVCSTVLNKANNKKYHENDRYKQSY